MIAVCLFRRSPDAAASCASLASLSILGRMGVRLEDARKDMTVKRNPTIRKRMVTVTMLAHHGMPVVTWMNSKAIWIAPTGVKLAKPMACMSPMCIGTMTEDATVDRSAVESKDGSTDERSSMPGFCAAFSVGIVDIATWLSVDEDKETAGPSICDKEGATVSLSANEGDGETELSMVFDACFAGVAFPSLVQPKRLRLLREAGRTDGRHCR